jgi:hypothetical protein
MTRSVVAHDGNARRLEDGHVRVVVLTTAVTVAWYLHEIGTHQAPFVDMTSESQHVVAACGPNGIRHGDEPMRFGIVRVQPAVAPPLDAALRDLVSEMFDRVVPVVRLAAKGVGQDLRQGEPFVRMVHSDGIQLVMEIGADVTNAMDDQKAGLGHDGSVW